MLYLGVDGGGTKTAFVLINEKGQIVAYSVKATCHYKQTSFENFRTIIDEGINDICQKGRISRANIAHSFLGIPGFGEIEKDIPHLENIIESLLGDRPFSLNNDAVAAWAGSLASRPGINMVAGTGTIALGMNEKGEFARAGGWGHFCGDEGSAHWIGKKAIEIFSKESDGRMIKTPLYYILKDELNLQKDFDLIELVITDLAMKRDEIGKFSKILYKSALENDKEAIRVLKEAAYEHYLCIDSVINQLGLNNEEILISYSGGVFNAGEYVLNPLREYLKDRYEKVNLIQPILSPVLGAGLYAMLLDSQDITSSTIENLKREEINWKIS